MSVVPQNSSEYESACRNSDNYELKEATEGRIKFGHWFEEQISANLQ
jgi:hypothetical protein